MPSKAMMFYHHPFQDAKTQESIANVVDVAVANFIKDVQNLWCSSTSPCKTVLCDKGERAREIVYWSIIPHIYLSFLFL